MSASLHPPRIDRPGVVYVVAKVGVDIDAGPFKLGESGESGESRLRTSLTFQHPDHPLDVVGYHRCFDRAWVEDFIHRALTAYRCEPPPQWRAKGRKPEWFRCSMAEVQKAVENALRADRLHREQAEKALAACAKTSPDASEPPANWLVDAVLTSRVQGSMTLRQMVSLALCSEVGYRKYSGKLLKLGFRCVPLERLAAFRTDSTEFISFMEKLGISDFRKSLKRISGIDHDCCPLPLSEIKKRCRGYDVAELLR